MKTEEIERKKKVLLISNMYPSKKYPHYGVFVRNAAELLRESGYTVSVCCVHKQNSRLKKIAGYFFFYLKSIILGVFGGFDCVYAHFISHTAIPVRVIRLFHPKIRIVGNAHGNDVVADTEEDRINLERSRKALAITDWVIVPSSYYRNVMINEYSFPAQRLIVSPSGGINLALFSPMDKQHARDLCGLDSGAVYLGYISRIEPLKGWETFITAVKQLVNQQSIPGLRILVLGSGSEEAKLHQLCGQLDLLPLIDFRPFASQKELAFYYNSLDAFCFPSERESLGLVGLEAMACGVPVICSDAKGIQTYAKNEENCLMFPMKNYEALCGQMVRLLHMHTDQRNRLVENALLTAKEFDSKKIKEEFMRIFPMILE